MTQLNPGRRSLGGGNPDNVSGAASGRVGRVISLDAGYSISPRKVGHTRFEQVDIPREVLERNDALHELRAARLAVGLSADGMATYTYSLGSGAYDPLDEGDISRVRRIIREADGDEVANEWIPALGLVDEPTDTEPDAEPRPRCHVCGARFPTHSPLRRHFELHHPDADPPPEPAPLKPTPVPPPEPEPVSEPTPDEIREVYADDPFVSEREIPPWYRS